MISLVVTPDRTKQVVIPDSKPPTISVSILSPIIKQFAECTSNFFRAKNIMAGFGFPKKYGVTPVTFSMGETKAPHAGTGPLKLGPVKS